MSDSPEHDKLMKIAPTSQAIGEFLTWLRDVEGQIVCEWCSETGEYVPSFVNITDLLARYFEIDLNKIEAEKRTMLDHIREMNTREAAG